MTAAIFLSHGALASFSRIAPGWRIRKLAGFRYIPVAARQHERHFRACGTQPPGVLLYHSAATKTAAIAVGHAYLSAHTHHRRAKGVVSISSACTMARLICQPTNTLVVKAPAGSSTLDGTK